MVKIQDQDIVNACAPRLIDLRNQQGLSQEQAANMLGVSRATLSHWETGKRVPDAVMLRKMCFVYDCEPNEIYGEPCRARIHKLLQGNPRGDTPTLFDCIHRMKAKHDSGVCNEDEIKVYRRALSITLNILLEELAAVNKVPAEALQNKVESVLNEIDALSDG